METKEEEEKEGEEGVKAEPMDVDGESATATTDAKEKETVAAADTPAFQKTPAVGFLAGGWRGGVHPPHPLVNMPDWSCGIADILSEFTKTSPFAPYDSKVHKGLWRTVAIRCSVRTEECMMVVVHATPAGGGGVGASTGTQGGEEDPSIALFDVEKKRLVDMLTAGPIPIPVRDVEVPSAQEKREDEVKEGDAKEEAKESDTKEEVKET